MSQSTTPAGELENEFAERPESLEDRKIAYVDLGKPNGEELFNHLEQKLIEEFNVEDVKYFKKPHVSSPMPENQIEEIIDWGAEGVIEAISDCGSCNSSSTVDAIELEQRGVPTVQVITDEFVDINSQIASSHGYEEMPLVTVEHPTRYLETDEVSEMVDRIKWSITTTLTCEECLDGSCSIDIGDS